MRAKGQAAWLISFGIFFASAFNTFPQSWTITSAPSNSWSAIACSADGKKVLAAANGGLIYVSTNSGIDWIPTSAPVAGWGSLACSADGEKILAVPFIGYALLSTNSGADWTPTGSFLSNGVVSSACSADGSKLFIVPNLHISLDGGMSWSTDSAFYAWWVVCSADGRRLATSYWHDGNVLTSSDYGATWHDTGHRSCFSLASSADGGRLATTACSFWVEVSTDAGTTWRDAHISGPPTLYMIVSSADGKKLLAAGGDYWNSGPIFYTTNAGATWTSNAIPAPEYPLPQSARWSSIALSADGSVLFAAVNHGSIYRGQTDPLVELEAVAEAGRLKLSSIFPSQRFVLQENSDLNTSNWTDVAAEPVLNFTNLHHEVSVPLSSSNRFYRLKRL